MLIITAMLSFKSARCHSNSQLVSSDNSKEGEYPPGAELQCQHCVVNMTFIVHADDSSKGKQLICYEE